MLVQVALTWTGPGDVALEARSARLRRRKADREPISMRNVVVTVAFTTLGALAAAEPLAHALDYTDSELVPLRKRYAPYKYENPTVGVDDEAKSAHQID